MTFSNLQSPLYVDLRSAALGRIALGTTLAVDFARRYAESWQYAPHGMLPASSLAFPHSWSPYVWLGDATAAVRMLLAATAAIAALYAAGAWTRIAGPLLWLLVVAAHLRNPVVLDGADAYARLLLFWCLFIPTGAHWSIDAWWAGRTPTSTDTTSAPAPPTDAPPLAALALIAQVCVVYVATGIGKANHTWTSGLAVGRTLSYLYYPTSAGAHLAAFPKILEWASYLTPLGEAVLPLLLLLPARVAACRLASIGALAAMHLGILVVYDVGLFSIVSLCGLAMLLPRELWRKPAGRAARLPTAAAALVVLAIALNAVANTVSYLPGESSTGNAGTSARAASVVELLGFKQSWRMFRSVPARVHWPLFVGRMRDGTRVRLPDGGRLAEAPARADLTARFGSYREKRAYLNTLRDMPYTEVVRRRLALRGCARWPLASVQFVIFPLPDALATGLGDRYVAATYPCP
jgi:hypothetical protein